MSAPGYQSYAWTTQDWRTVQVHEDGRVSWDRKCGDDSTLPSGRKRLCLPRAVLEAVARRPGGVGILRGAALAKQRAAPGDRVAWPKEIKDAWRALEARTEADDPRKRKRNPGDTMPPKKTTPKKTKLAPATAQWPDVPPTTAPYDLAREVLLAVARAEERRHVSPDYVSARAVVGWADMNGGRVWFRVTDAALHRVYVNALSTGTAWSPAFPPLDPETASFSVLVGCTVNDKALLASGEALEFADCNGDPRAPETWTLTGRVSSDAEAERHGASSDTETAAEMLMLGLGIDPGIPHLFANNADYFLDLWAEHEEWQMFLGPPVSAAEWRDVVRTTRKLKHPDIIPGWTMYVEDVDVEAEIISLGAYPTELGTPAGPSAHNQLGRVSGGARGKPDFADESAISAYFKGGEFTMIYPDGFGGDEGEDQGRETLYATVDMDFRETGESAWSAVLTAAARLLNGFVAAYDLDFVEGIITELRKDVDGGKDVDEVADDSVFQNAPYFGAYQPYVQALLTALNQEIRTAADEYATDYVMAYISGPVIFEDALALLAMRGHGRLIPRLLAYRARYAAAATDVVNGALLRGKSSWYDDSDPSDVPNLADPRDYLPSYGVGGAPTPVVDWPTLHEAATAAFAYRTGTMREKRAKDVRAPGSGRRR